MADQAAARGGPGPAQGAPARDRAPSSPQKLKVVRSQRIAAPSTSPVEARPPAPAADSDDTSEAQDRTPPIPRSHTPGHLASKSQDRRRKPSELSIRQRSQSAATLSAPASAPLSASASVSKATTPTSARYASGAENGDPAMTALARQDSSAGSGKEAGSATSTTRRPAALRSTSAIASRTGTGPSIASTTTTVSRAPRGATARAARAAATHIPFPPLANPKTAPDVPAAPSSGMYWSRAPVSGSAHTALRAHTTTLVGSNVFVFGGCDSRACFNELYVLDADSFHWSTPTVVGDVPVPLRAMTCTAVGKKLVIFGGGDGPAYYNDVYVLDTVNFRWSRPRIVGDRVPSKRRAHTACLYKNGIYVFGGGDGVRALNDIWRLDVGDFAKMSWELVSGPSSPGPSSQRASPVSRDPAGAGAAPKARGYHTANMVGSKLIIYGGSDGGECFNDVWVYDVNARAWKPVTIPVTFRRLSHTATIVGSYLFVIGGHDGNEYSHDVLLLNLVTMTWDQRKVYGLPPSGRGYHGTVLYDSRLMVIGGFDGSEVFGDVWVLELAVHAYYSQISHFTIEV